MRLVAGLVAGTLRQVTQETDQLLTRLLNVGLPQPLLSVGNVMLAW